MRKLAIVALTAIFFFTLSFTMTYYGIGPLSPLGGRIVDDHVAEDAPSTNNDQEVIEPDQKLDSSVERELSYQRVELDDESYPSETLTSLDSNVSSIVEVKELPPLSYEEVVDQWVQESMATELNFQWDEDQRYLGIFGNHVAVYQGEPGVGGRLIVETDIPLSTLPEFEIQNLRTGIPFRSEEEKYSILEGLHFPK